MASLGSVKDLLKKQLEEPDQCAKRRELWRETTKPLILAALRKIADDKQVNEWTRNPLSARINGFPGAESVFLELPTVMIESVDVGGTMTGLFRKSGVLCYSLLADGKVFVWHSWPHIEDRQTPPPNVRLTILDPKEMTEELIFDHAVRFLTNINAAEAREPFGFGSWKPVSEDD